MGSERADHLLCTLPFPEPTNILEELKKKHPLLKITWRNVSGIPPSTVDDVPIDVWKDATILVTLGALPPSQAACPHLALIHLSSAGTNHIQSHPLYTDTNITLTTSSGIHGPQIAEHVLMTLLVTSHHYHDLHAWQLAHVWGKGGRFASPLLTVRDSVGQRIGILGYGSIGRQVARVAHAMGMDVIAHTAHARPTPASRRDHGFVVPGTGDRNGDLPREWHSGTDIAALHAFLARDLDVLLVSVPLTPATHGLLGRAEFDLLAARNTFVVNISRGPIIVQADLIRALHAYADDSAAGVALGQRRGLRGASLDVTDPEPLPAESELWDAPNCIVTPHVSGLGTAYWERVFDVLEVNLARRERGEDLINVVDRKRGY